MQVKKISETEDDVRLSVTASAAEMTRAFDEGLDVFVAQYNLEDFEGDTAAEKITSAMGEEDASSALYSAVVNFLVPFAMEEYGVVPLSTYDIASDETPEAGKEFTFDMSVLVKPEFELSSYDAVTVEVPAAPVATEDDIEQQLNLFIRQFVAAQTNKDPNDPTLEVPEINDAWVAENLEQMQLSTVEELRDRFRQASIEELEDRYQQLKMNAAMAEYMKRFTGKPTEKMIAVMTEELYESLLAELAHEGLTFDQFSVAQGITVDDVKQRFSQQAEYQLIQGFVLDAIYRHEKLIVGVEDLKAALHGMAPGREEETFDAMQKSGRGFLLKEAAARMKAAQWIMDHAEFTEAE